jgi:hypothetical protein
VGRSSRLTDEPRPNLEEGRLALALAPRRSPAPNATGVPESEVYRALLARAHRQTGRLPPDRIVRHVLAIARGGDWPVQRDALDAVLRRCASAHADEIQIRDRPRGRVRGLYTTRRRGSGGRPYRTLLRRIDPLDGSCDCADFLRSSLAICKHLVAVLEFVCAQRRDDDGTDAAVETSPLNWDPVRPLTGVGDWLARVRWIDGTPPRDLRQWLRRTPEHEWRVVAPERPADRLALVDRLRAILGSGAEEPALHVLLSEERTRLTRVLEATGTRRQLHAVLKTLKQPLYPYQRDGVERFLTAGRLLLADDMGLGKTAQAIAACHALWHTGRVRRGLLVVPAALKPQWIREWQMFTDAPIAVVDGAPAQRRTTFEGCKRGFLLGNYEQLINPEKRLS